MTAHELHDVLREDGRNWPDHIDYYRHGPTRAVCSVPPVLRIDSTTARNIRLVSLAWIAKQHA